MTQPWDIYEIFQNNPCLSQGSLLVTGVRFPHVTVGWGGLRRTRTQRRGRRPLIPSAGPGHSEGGGGHRSGNLTLSGQPARARRDARCRSVNSQATRTHRRLGVRATAGGSLSAASRSRLSPTERGDSDGCVRIGPIRVSSSSRSQASSLQWGQGRRPSATGCRHPLGFSSLGQD